ncbi:MAG: hypothetical protein ABIK65_09230 [Candidatus Eisenbacteria bacterium]
MRRTVLSLTALTLTVLAIVPPAAGGVTPWLEIGGRYGTYAMDDVNDDIAAIDALIWPTRFDEISGGLGFGTGAGLRVSPNLDIGIRYERFMAKSEASDFSGSITYDFGANGLFGFMEYRFPSSSKISGGIGAGGGLVVSSGEVGLTVTGVGSVSGDTEGSGPLLQGYGFIDLPLSPRVSIIPSAGYRYAKVSSLEIDGLPVYNADGSDYSVDYSGVFLSASIRFLLGG